MLTKYSSLDLLEMDARDSWLMELTERWLAVDIVEMDARDSWLLELTEMWLAVEMTLVIPQYGHAPLLRQRRST